MPTEVTTAVHRIPVEDLVPNPQNPRRITDKHPSLPSLAQSLKESGQVVPIVVRPIRTGPDEITGYQILAGERRWRAARLAKLEALDAIVREVDDQTAFTICVIENLQREDLHWLEEARGVGAMVEKGWSIETIAAQLGKSVGWVHLRSKLADLSPKFLAAVEKHERFQQWPVAMVEVIARLPHEVQDQICGKQKDYEILNADSAAELHKVIRANYLHQLAAAPWDIHDAKLVPKAGACSSCPKRSSCQQSLFEDAKGDTCLDVKCWSEKKQAHREAAIAELRKEAPTARIAIRENAGWEEKRELRDSFGGKVLDSYEFKVVKEGTKGAKPAILMGGGNPKLGYVVLGNAAASAAKAEASEKKSAPTPPKERLEAFMKRRTAYRVGVVIGKLGGPSDSNSPNHWKSHSKMKACAPDVKRPGIHVLMAVAVEIGMRDEYLNYHDHAWKRVGDMVKDGAASVEDAFWERLRNDIIGKLIADREYRGEDEGAEYVAGICGLDWKAIVAEAQDKLPLPRTLAEYFNEDGTKRTSATAAAVVKPAKKAKAASAKG